MRRWGPNWNPRSHAVRPIGGQSLPASVTPHLLSSCHKATLAAMGERRQVPRYFAEVSAVVYPAGSASGSSVTVVVLSVQGCCVQGAGVPEVGKKCQLTLEWQGDEIRSEALVVWKGLKGEAGLRFLSMDQQSSETLRALCATLRLQPMPPLSSDE
jgi:hypothetical protein